MSRNKCCTHEKPPESAERLDLRSLHPAVVTIRLKDAKRALHAFMQLSKACKKDGCSNEKGYSEEMNLF